tara:strand:- start:29 stop:166 length:138 start_codon:yes stop_codon:yes gene_type:complete
MNGLAKRSQQAPLTQVTLADRVKALQHVLHHVINEKTECRVNDVA